MEPLTLWQWQVKQPNGRWRLLRWRMTEADAQAWAKSNSCELRKIEMSAEARTPEDRTGGLMTHLGTAK